ncbi:MAG: hypothetical protein ACT4OZ_14000 [Gemmatimonadota bacterium]
MGRFPLLLLVGAAAAAASACARSESPATEPSFLYLWSASTDSTQPDFLAVVDVREDSGGYGRLVTTLPVSGTQNGPHHTEHDLSSDRQLFANGFASGRSFVFDLSNDAQPRLAAEFGELEGYRHPHSFLRLPGGNVLATFQMRHEGGSMRPGGLVELTPAGRIVRSSSAAAPGIDSALRVYSGAIVPALDRIVTTTTDMDRDATASRNIQVWRLSDLALLHTFALPDGPGGGEGLLTAEPRLLADGRTVLVSTFSCGLYLLSGIDGPEPAGRLVASFPRKERTNCAIPVVTGNYYLVTVPSLNAVVSLDITDPAAPREAGRMTLGTDDVPHWISISPDGRRVVVTGYAAMRHRVVVARFDPSTGAIVIDDRFRDPGATEPGFRMDNKTWPHGGNTPAVPHGAVFSR